MKERIEKGIELKDVEAMIYLKALSYRQITGKELNEIQIERARIQFEKGFKTIMNGDMGGKTPNGDRTYWSVEEVKKMLDDAGYEYKEVIERYCYANI